MYRLVEQSGGNGTALRLIIIAATAVSCSSGSETAQLSERSFVTEDSGGVRVVTSRRPLLADSAIWWVDSVPVVQIGVRDGEDEYLFGRVTDAKRWPDGGLEVVESRTREIREYGRDRAFRRGFGGIGEGPGEFVRPPSIQLDEMNTVLAWDYGGRRLTWYTRDGRVIRTIGLPLAEVMETLGGIPASQNEVRVATDGTLLVAVARSVDLQTSAEGVNTISQSLGLVAPESRTVVLITSAHLYETAIARGVIVYNELVPRLQFARHKSGGRVYVSASDRPEIVVHSSDGSLLEIWRLEVPRSAVAGEVRDRQRECLRAGRVANGQDPSSGLAAFDLLSEPDSVPAIAGLRVDGSGNLWIQRWEPPGDRRTTRYDVVRGDGAWLGSVSVSSELGEITEIGED